MLLLHALGLTKVGLTKYGLILTVPREGPNRRGQGETIQNYFTLLPVCVCLSLLTIHPTRPIQLSLYRH